MKQRRRTDASRKGFTLVELLVVIAIILLLAALLLPALTKMRLKAHSAVCTSNLRNIGLAIYGYASDYRNYAPSYEIGPYYWDDPSAMFIQQYLRSDTVFRCPSVGLPFEFNAAGVQTNPRFGYYPSPNRWLTADRQTGVGGVGGALADYSISAEYSSVPACDLYPFFCDRSAPLDLHIGDVTLNPLVVGRLVGTPPDQSHLVYDGRWTPANSESSDTYANGQDTKAPRHIDGTIANVLYVDGHVAGFKPLALIPGYLPTIPH